MMTNQCLVVLPTFNENGNIQLVINRLLRCPNCHVLVVDDSSPDGTAQTVTATYSGCDRVYLKVNPCRGGVGRALLDGIAYGVDRGFGRVILMDADGSHDANDVGLLEGGLEGSDLVIGIRSASIGITPDWGFRRALLADIVSLCWRVVGMEPLKDPTCGFRAMSNRACQELISARPISNGYSIHFEISVLGRILGWKIGRVSVNWHERFDGSSKLSLLELIRAGGTFAKIVWRYRGGCSQNLFHKQDPR